MAQTQLLFAGSCSNFGQDGLWTIPLTSHGPGFGDGDAEDTGAFFSGPGGCVIEDIYYIARDVDFTDPDTDVYMGWRVRYSSDGGTSHTTLDTVWASADCPQLWDDGAGDTGDFAENVPVRAHAFYAAGAGGLVDNFYGSLLIPANVHVTFEVAPVAAEALITLADGSLDSFDVLVYGYFKG